MKSSNEAQMKEGFIRDPSNLCEWMKRLSILQLCGEAAVPLPVLAGFAVPGPWCWLGTHHM